MLFVSSRGLFSNSGTTGKVLLHTHTHALTHTAAQPYLIPVYLKGQKPMTGGTFFRRTVLGEFSKEFIAKT